MQREGYIEKIIYHNEENGYSVFQVETAEGDEIFVGNGLGISEGFYISAEGEFVVHPQYDLQFKFESYELSVPGDIVGIERYLASGVIKGIGEVTAGRIVSRFGEDSLRIIEEEPERLAEIKGISLSKAQKIALSYSENKESRDVLIFLAGYGISTTLAMKIYKEYGAKTFKVIKENPYRISEDIEGIGFKKADELAVRSGISLYSEERVRAAIVYILNSVNQNGHMYYPKDILINEAESLLEGKGDELFRDNIENALISLSMERKIFIEEIDNETAVYSSWNHYVENESAYMLGQLSLSDVDSEENVARDVRSIEKNSDIDLDDVQREAVITAVTESVSIITGGPGTGKTTIISIIMKYFLGQGKTALLAAPTGRAAKRITESTGYSAKTIHRLLEFGGSSDKDSERGRLKFGRNENNPLECDVVIIDEASMVDSVLFYSLLKALPSDSRLVLVGDTDQLPSVGAGNVLKDMIGSGCFTVIRLEHIYRQDEKSAIITNAHKIKTGEHIIIDNKSSDFFFIPKRGSAEIKKEVIELVSDNLPKYLKISPLEVPVIAPMKKYETGVEELNRSLQKSLNPPGRKKREKDKNDVVFRVGDKVMQTKNNYNLEWKIFGDTKKNIAIEEGIGVFNGDMGIIADIDELNEEVTVEFDDGRVCIYDYNSIEELSHAFAITIHKSQGSEYKAVVIPLLYGPPKLFNRNLIYTAVTRAKQMVVLVGNVGLVNKMIDNTEEQKRYTGFLQKLKKLL